MVGHVMARLMYLRRMFSLLGFFIWKFLLVIEDKTKINHV